MVHAMQPRSFQSSQRPNTTKGNKNVNYIKVYDRVYLSLNPVLKSRNDCAFARVSIESCVDVMEPSSLSHIYCFHQAIVDMLEQEKEKDLVILTGSDPAHITAVALLLGGHLIIGRGMSVEDVVDRFRPISYLFASFADGNTRGPDLSIEDCWRAIHRATALGWASFDPPQAEDGQERIDMEEYLHYDDTPNGAMHLVDPARLLLFREPADLPAGVAWADEGGRRRFGPEHYAGLFEDFGVQLVVRCGGGAWDCEALRGAGMAVEDLRVEAGGAGMLSAVDRFLTLARVAPGCIAVQCGGGAGAERIESEDGGAGEGDDEEVDGDTGARLVVAAHLIRSRGFRAAEAVAWGLIAHPRAAARAAPALVAL